MNVKELRKLLKQYHQTDEVTFLVATPPNSSRAPSMQLFNRISRQSNRIVICTERHDAMVGRATANKRKLAQEILAIFNTACVGRKACFLGPDSVKFARYIEHDSGVLVRIPIDAITEYHACSEIPIEDFFEMIVGDCLPDP